MCHEEKENLEQDFENFLSKKVVGNDDLTDRQYRKRSFLQQVCEWKIKTIKLASTECARDCDLYELVSCCKFVNEILFCIIYKNTILLGDIMP